MQLRNGSARTDPLAHIPGDYGLPVLGNTLKSLRDSQGTMRRMYQRYGPVFRTSFLFQRFVILVGPEAAQQVLSDRENVFSSAGGWAFSLGELFPRGLMLRDFAEHRQHRQLMKVAFQPRAMEGYLDGVNRTIREGIASWSDIADFRFYRAIKRLLLDIAARVFMGLELGGEVDRLNAAFIDAVAATSTLIRYPLPGTIYRRGKQGRALLERYLTGLIAARRRSDGSDLFSELCRARSENGEAFTDQEIVDHTIFLMMAAHDTSASALTTMIYALARYPEWQERIRAEGRAVAKAELGYQEARAHDSASLAMKEALRMYPPVPIIPRRVVRSTEAGGYRLPANTMVALDPTFNHHLPEIWRDPDRFDPLRFAPPREEHKQHRFAWMPFGGGAHLCLGKHFAEITAHSFVHQLLQRYRLRLPSGYRVRYTMIPLPRPRDHLPVVLEPIDGVGATPAPEKGARGS